MVENRVQVTFLRRIPCALIIRMPGWTVLALAQGMSQMEALTTLREMLTTGERDVVRQAFGVAPLSTDPTKRAWVSANVPDALCPCVIPVQLRAIEPWWEDCVLCAVEPAADDARASP